MFIPDIDCHGHLFLIQQKILDKNIQITLFIGPPGCGKSHKIRQLKDEYKDNVLIFSPTNSNNQICNGQTIFKWLNCTPFSLDKANIRRINQELVIFDEIFMITAEQFNAILKCEPQKIYCFGDPYQIHQSNQSYFYRDIDTSKVKIELMTTYYRATDENLIQILEQYRRDKKLSSFNFPLLDEKLIPHYVQKLEWTLLVGKKRAITYYGRKMKYDFTDKSGTMWYYNQRVMIINQYGNCVKISQIQSYDYDSGIITLTTTEEMKPKKRGNKVYYLLDRADIITVNLSQGLTLKGVLLDFGSFFEYGSAYTAISRVKELKQIKMLSRPVVIQEADLSNEFLY